MTISASYTTPRDSITVLTVPILTALQHVTSPVLAFALIVVALAIVSFYTSISGIVKAEMFPPEVRALGVGLAYAIGNQTIAQRLFAVREDLIKPTFVTATVGYGATIIGVDMMGVLALYAGIDPANVLPPLTAYYVMKIGNLPLAGTSGHDFGEVLGSLAGVVFEDFSATSAKNNNGTFDGGGLLFGAHSPSSSYSSPIRRFSRSRKSVSS